jgi:hypothetical protein
MRKHHVLRFAVLLGFTLHAAGCATIVTGGNQSVTFNSNPDGATIKLDDTAMGKTPITLSLKKKAGQTLAFEREGYEPLTTQLTTKTNPWIFGNILIGGLLGCSTDVVSGALYQYAPDRYMVTLQPVQSAFVQPLEFPATASTDSGSAQATPTVSDGVGSLEAHTVLNDAQKRKDYIVRNYDDLINDLKRGPAAKTGEYLASLLTMLNVKPNLEYDAVKRIRALSEEYPDIVEFADRVIEEFGG